MDPESNKFGKGPRELTGAVDLISYYRLLPHLDFFCKKSLPLSVSDTHYLRNAVGDTEIRKGEGMQLDQLIQNTCDTNTRIHPFDLDTLNQAFQLRETAPVELPSSEKGIPTAAGKSKRESKDKEKKRKDRDKEHKKHRHRHKDKDKDKSSHHQKKRKHEGDEDLNAINRHKKSKHKSSKMDEMGAIKIAA